jgi:hypothetical protein
MPRPPFAIVIVLVIRMEKLPGVGMPGLLPNEELKSQFQSVSVTLESDHTSLPIVLSPGVLSLTNE